MTEKPQEPARGDLTDEELQRLFDEHENRAMEYLKKSGALDARLAAGETPTEEEQNESVHLTRLFEQSRRVNAQNVFCLVQTYARILEAVATGSMGYADLELNAHYLKIVNLIRLLLASPQMKDCPVDFQPAVDHVLPGTDIDVTWDDVLLPEIHDFLSKIQEYALSNAPFPNEEESPLAIPSQVITAACQRAIEATTRYRAEVERRFQGVVKRIEAKRLPGLNDRKAGWLVDTIDSLLEFVHVHREQFLTDKELSTLDSLGTKMNRLAVALDLTTPDIPVYYGYRAELAHGIGPDIVNPTWPGAFTDRGSESGFLVQPTLEWLKRIHALRDKAKALSAPEVHKEVPLADQSTPETEYFLWLTIEHPPHEICFYSLKDSEETQIAGRLCGLFTMKYSDADPYVPEYQNPVFDYRAAADLDPDRAFLIRDEIERFRQRNDWVAKATLTAFSSVSDLGLARQELGSYCYKQAAIWEKELRDEARPPQSQHLAEAGAADTQGAAKGAIASSSGPTRTAKSQSSRKEATDHNDELRAYEEARWKELEAAFHRGEVHPLHVNQAILWWLTGPKKYAVARLQGYPSEEEIGHRFALSLETMARAAESHGLNSAAIAKSDHVLSKYGREALKILSAHGKEMDALAPIILNANVFPPGKGPNPQERVQFERGLEVIGRLNAINGQQLMAAAAQERRAGDEKAAEGGKQRGRVKREVAEGLILKHLIRRPHDTTADVAEAVGCSVGVVAESPAWKANQDRLKTAKKQGVDPKAVKLDLKAVNVAGGTRSSQKHRADEEREARDAEIDEREKELYKQIRDYQEEYPDATPEQVAKALGCTAGDVERRQAALNSLTAQQAEEEREDKDEPDPNARRGKRRKWVGKRV